MVGLVETKVKAGLIVKPANLVGVNQLRANPNDLTQLVDQLNLCVPLLQSVSKVPNESHGKRKVSNNGIWNEEGWQEGHQGVRYLS